jgi:adenylate cyclase
MGQMKAGLRSFEKYVPRDLVRQLVRTGREAEVQGETREVSILFSDVAGFTGISEGLDPEALVAHLNRYFDHATNVLLTHGATIDKYIGDAIMAFWGAPRQQQDHAERACRAALGLRHSLDTLNAEWSAAGHPPMHTRIGVHTGEVVVGNIGSDERLSYTIIGDAVNLASRIEGINKTYGTWVTASEHTYRRVQDLVVGQALDVVAVKGRREGVLLYSLLGLRASASEAELTLERLSAEALDHYRARRWDEAIRAWEEISRLRDGADPAARLLVERCRAYQQHPPPEGWDGIWVASHK